MKLHHLLLLLPTLQVTYAKEVVAYFIAWGTYDRKYMPDMIPASQITLLNYAFANLDDSNQLILGDPYADTEKMYPGDTETQEFKGAFWQINKVLKPKNPNMKTLISIGGWTWSGKFSTMAATEQGRQTFAKSCKEFIDKYGFDGVDVDWEYPVLGGLPTNAYSPDDGVNYSLLLQAIRAAIGSDKLLTIAAPAGPDKVQHLELDKMAQVLDYINIMTYDFKGGWSKYTGHHTPLFPSTKMAADDPDKALTDTATVVDNFIAGGMPASKIIVGAAMYGRGWSGVGNTNNGLFQPFSSVPAGTWDKGEQTGVFDYDDLKAKGYTRYWDDEVKAPWLYDAASGMMISYDDPQSVREKGAFIASKGLAGVMFWELSGDRSNELLTTAISAMGGGGGAVTPPPVISPPPTTSTTGTTGGTTTGSDNMAGTTGTSTSGTTDMTGTTTGGTTGTSGTTDMSGTNMGGTTTGTTTGTTGMTGTSGGTSCNTGCSGSSGTTAGNTGGSTSSYGSYGAGTDTWGSNGYGSSDTTAAPAPPPVAYSWA